MELMTKCEEMVMSVIWDKGEEEALSTIMEAANRRFEKEWKPQTVRTLLTRRRIKGYLVHTIEREDPVHVLVWSRMYTDMEKCCDTCEHVADAMSTIVLKNV